MVDLSPREARGTGIDKRDQEGAVVSVAEKTRERLGIIEVRIARLAVRGNLLCHCRGESLPR